MTENYPLHAGRLKELRANLEKNALDGFLVPMTDPYLNEYVPPSERRIEFLSGFTGSYAFVLVLMRSAVFFTDSRYTLQAREQVDPVLFEIYDVAHKQPRDWIKENLQGPLTLGFDPRLHSETQIELMQKTLNESGIKLFPVLQNPVDTLWNDRPEPVHAPVFAHEEIYAGKKSLLKRAELAAELEKRKIDAAVIASPDSVAWLLNIRGGDLPDTPLPFCRALLRSDARVELFVEPEKLPKDFDLYLGSDVTLYPEKDFEAGLKRLGEARNRVLVDPSETPYLYYDLLSHAGASIEKGEDPCVLPRACKNPTEINGMRAAHRRDGAALVRLLAWLDAELPRGKVTELDICEKLEVFRAEGSLHRGPSFHTIAGSGPNGAIVHYRPDERTNRVIDGDSFLLIDSGAQYLDGTTDVTRTVATGNLTQEMKDRFTRVLKGHIALASIRFPAGTSGADLEALARQYLWAIGEDYGHGTGHGVGSYLSVHEGPHGISHSATAQLRAGMVVSNEPGFYKARFYGIRHENLQYVTELLDISSSDRKMLGFEPLTLVPFDKRGLATELLTQPEIDWLNAYHARVAKALLPQLDNASGQWLLGATSAL